MPIAIAAFFVVAGYCGRREEAAEDAHARATAPDLLRRMGDELERLERERLDAEM